MSRLLALTTGLLALAACAGQPRRPGPDAVPPEPPPPRVIAIPGMERQPGELVTEHDIDRDGKPDVWTHSRKEADGREVVVRREKDLNGDGRIDTWEASGPDGSAAKLIHDLDFDGRPDVTLTFENGRLVKQEHALGFDGVSRTSSFYEDGELVRKERDANADGKVDSWEYWRNGEIVRTGVDRDGDGREDRSDARQPGDPAAAQK